MWKSATNYADAVRLAWAIEQYELSLAMGVIMDDFERDTPEVAASLDMPRRQLWSKLTGRAPAKVSDLIMWSWLTNKQHKRPPVRELLVNPTNVLIPSLHRIREQSTRAASGAAGPSGRRTSR